MSTDPECLCYSPSTLAISALLLTFSKLRLNCREWLHCLPDECLPPKTVWGTNSPSPIPGHHPIFSDDEISYLNIDLCILALQRVQIPCNRRVSFTTYASPTPSKEGQSPSPVCPARDQHRRDQESKESPVNSSSSEKVLRMTPTSTVDLCLWSWARLCPRI